MGLAGKFDARLESNWRDSWCKQRLIKNFVMLGDKVEQGCGFPVLGEYADMSMTPHRHLDFPHTFKAVGYRLPGNSGWRD